MIFKDFLCFLILFSTFNTAKAKQADQTVKEKEENGREAVFLPQFEHILSQTVGRGVTSGTSAINNNLDSLMNSIFYNLLNNNFSQNITSYLTFNENLSRAFFTTDLGKIIIIEQFKIGPEYLNKIGNIIKLPIHLGSKGSLTITKIYPSSDLQRNLTKQQVPTFRFWANNWFGLLNLAEKILPPIFEAAKLYDPISYIKTPFEFPINLQRFNQMQTGTVISYSFNGGITLPFSLNDPSPKESTKQSWWKKANYLLPYSIFVHGEFKISVFKSSKKIALVGLSTKKQLGHSLGGLIGTTFYLLKDSFSFFSGLPAAFTLVDVSASNYFIKNYNQIYKFDLSKKIDLDNYKRAIGGDFTSSKNSSKIDKKNIELEKTSFSMVKNTKNTKNFLLTYGVEKVKNIASSKTKINGLNNSDLILEVNINQTDRSTNILTGPENYNISGQLSLNVKDLPSINKNKKAIVFNSDKNIDKYQLILKIKINDKIANSYDYYDYIKTVKDFSNLDITDYPAVPKVEKGTDALRRKRLIFSSPSDVVLDIHNTSTNVGSINISGTISFNENMLTKIIDSSEQNLNLAFSQAFEIKGPIELPPNFLTQLPSTLLYPLRVFNIRIPSIDAYPEIERNVLILKEINSKSTPLEIQKSFNRLFNTDYTLQLIKGLHNILKDQEAPARIRFFIKPNNQLTGKLKDDFLKLNNRSFNSKAKFPKAAVSSLSQEKIATFSPDGVGKANQIKTSLNKLTIRNDFSLVVSVNNVEENKPTLFLFFEIDTIKKFHFMNKEVLKDITTIRPTTQFKKGKREYYLDLIPISTKRIKDYPINYLNKTIGFEQNQKYKIKVSISQDKKNWSEFREINIVYKNGTVKEYTGKGK